MIFSYYSQRDKGTEKTRIIFSVPLSLGASVSNKI